MEKEKVYSKDETYNKGDVIYHPVFKEKGKIKKIEQVLETQQKLFVDFENIGKKTLIAGMTS